MADKGNANEPIKKDFQAGDIAIVIEKYNTEHFAHVQQLAIFD